MKISKTGANSSYKLICVYFTEVELKNTGFVVNDRVSMQVSKGHLVLSKDPNGCKIADNLTVKVVVNSVKGGHSLDFFRAATVAYTHSFGESIAIVLDDHMLVTKGSRPEEEITEAFNEVMDMAENHGYEFVVDGGNIKIVPRKQGIVLL